MPDGTPVTQLNPIREPETPAPSPAAAESPPASSSSVNAMRRLAIPILAVVATFIFVALATARWDTWTGNASVQTTNDAYVRAQTTRLSSRVAGEVKVVAVE